MKLGQRIQELRKKMGYSQQDFADILQIGRSTLANYEQCKRDPNYEMIELIAKKLKTSPSYLLGWEDNKGNVIGLEKKKFSFLYFDTDLETEKRRLIISGIYKTYKNNLNSYYKWLNDISSKIDESKDKIEKIQTYMLNLEIPFKKIDKADLKKLYEEYREYLISAQRHLEDFDYLLNTIYENEDEYSINIETSNDKREYLSKIYTDFDFSKLKDEEIEFRYEQFYTIEKKENEKFKKQLGIE